MTTKPLIGITGERRKGSDLRGSLRVMGNLSLDIFWADYAEGVLSAGGIPIFLPIGLQTDLIVNHLDGLLMSGGADISPHLYGADAEVELESIEPVRDQFELSLLEMAYERQLPIAGICRGLQILNVQAGGSLFQDVPPHAIRDKSPATRVHTVSIKNGSVLGELYGGEVEVNSLHHQSIDTVGENFQVSAISDDGIIEGIEHKELPVIAVQWHPEMLDTRNSDPIFKWLVSQALNR